MPEGRTVKKVLKNNSQRKRSVGKPRKRRLNSVENNLKKMGVKGWEKITNGRDAWKLILTLASLQYGQ